MFFFEIVEADLVPALSRKYVPKSKNPNKKTPRIASRRVEGPFGA